MAPLSNMRYPRSKVVAFERVNREKLWALLEDYGVKGQILDGIRAIYKDSLRIGKDQGSPSGS